jgi:hypothetical protein
MRGIGSDSSSERSLPEPRVVEPGVEHLVQVHVGDDEVLLERGVPRR